MAQTSDSVGQLLIGDGVTVQGTIRVTGRASVNGVIEGTLQADELIVGPSGHVTGKVTARRLEVGGKIDDTIEVSERLLVRSTGIVSGIIRYGELETERGAILSGMVERGTGVSG